MWLYAEIKSLGDIPRYYAGQKPDRPALIDQTGPTTWAALNERSNRIANALLALGVTSGARVAFLGKNTARYFELLFGANKAGAALLPLNWRLAVPEMVAIMQDADPIVLIADREYADIAATIAKASGEPGSDECGAQGVLEVVSRDGHRPAVSVAARCAEVAITLDPRPQRGGAGSAPAIVSGGLSPGI